jgi:hypothetical protein
MVEAKYFLKIKNALQKIIRNIFVSEVFIKHVIFGEIPRNYWCEISQNILYEILRNILAKFREIIVRNFPKCSFTKFSEIF